MLTAFFPQVSFCVVVCLFLLLPRDSTLSFLFLCDHVCVIMLSSGSTCRPHPYRKRPTLGNVSNQHMHHSIQQNYSLGYQDYSPEYPSLHQVTTRFSPFRNINIKGTITRLYYVILCPAAVHHCAQLLVCQAVWWDLFWCHLVDLLRNPWPTCMNSRRTLTLGPWQDSVSRYIQPCCIKATLTKRHLCEIAYSAGAQRGCHLVCLSLQLSRQVDYSKQISCYSYPPSPPMSYFSSGREASGTGSFPNTQLNRVSLDLLLL